IVAVSNDTRRPDQASVALTVGQAPPGTDGFLVLGHDSRIGQVIKNLVDNARSFSAPRKAVRVKLGRDGDAVEITVDDEGPGIPNHALERIFERFYTDRPNDGF